MATTVRPSAPVDDAMLPAIPTALAEVDVVDRWRDGLAGAVPVFEPESGPESGSDSGPESGSESSADLRAAAGRLGVGVEVLTALGVTASAGEVWAVPLPDERRAWVFGVGTGQPRQWRRAGAALAKAVRDALETPLGGPADLDDPADLGDPLDAEYVQVRLPDSADADLVVALVLGLSLGDYRFRVTGRPSPARLRRALLVAPKEADVASLRAAARRAREWASATALARDLSNVPSNVKNPAWFTSTAAGLAGDVADLQAVVRDEKWLAKRGFGGLLAVGGGSASPPRLLELSWRPRGAAAHPHLVLVGKGITFDTGGISLKPSSGMHLMRTDMAGGAAVIGATLTIARLGLPVRVTALVPSAENHMSGASYRPGDIVRHYGGKTTEVGNTDAEGRMVLADAMAYAIESHQPDLLVDVATLTGAMKVALGLRTGGLFATDEDLRRRLRGAGEKVAERWWPMPLLDDHAEDVRGEIADVRQTPPGPGGITAALFLREFTAGLPWAHLDIAGPARAESGYDEIVPGATGFAARTLVELAAGYATDEM